MFHPKYFFKFGLDLSNYMMAWLSITGLFDTGKELSDQVTLFMDTRQRVLEAIPLTGTAEEARHWNQKLGTGRAYIDTLRLFIMDGKPRIELIAKFEEIRKGLESFFL